VLLLESFVHASHHRVARLVVNAGHHPEDVGSVLHLIEGQWPLVGNRLLFSSRKIKRGTLLLSSECHLRRLSRFSFIAFCSVYGSLKHNIEYARIARLERLRAEIITSRQETVKKVFLQNYVRVRTPSTWSIRPPIEKIWEWEEFDTLINEEGERLLPEGEVKAVLDRIDTESRVKKRLNQSMRDYARQLPELNSRKPNLDSQAKLDLATSVFQWHKSEMDYFSQREILIGSRHILAFISTDQRRRDDSETINFSLRGRAAARMLVKLAGLNVREATGEDMDEKDLMFLCRCCVHGHIVTANEGPRRVMTWRESVSRLSSCFDVHQYRYRFIISST
jgi:hypothetical protein